MKIILLAFSVLGVGAFRHLTSDDFGNLLVKYVKNETDNSELKIINDVLKIYRASSNNKDGKNKTLKCFICRSKFSALFDLIHDGVPDTEIMSKGIYLCSLVKISKNLCRGYVEQNFPILKYIISNTREATPETFCGVKLQNKDTESHCANTDKRFDWEVVLPLETPKPLGTNEYEFNEHTSHFTVALISDIHLDPYYKQNSVANCDEPACCRAGQKPPTFRYKSKVNKIIKKSMKDLGGKLAIDLDFISKHDVDSYIVKLNSTPSPAGYWGDYEKCDTPNWTYSDVIDTIAKQNIDAVYYTGDSVDHHYWETTYELNDQTSTTIIDKMKKAFGKNVTVVPALGNHDSQPMNQFAPENVTGEGLNTTWLYENLAAKWNFSIDTSVFRRHGEFSVSIHPGLKVISVNNIVASKNNWWLVYDPYMAKRSLEWLVQELHTAELAGEKVHIISHIPPGHKRLIHTWTREYYRIIERFSSTIRAQFTGHTHTDELKLFYKMEKSDEIFSVAWGIGSIVTKGNLNPNYKIATFSKTYEPLNIETYTYNLTEANLSSQTPPSWYKLYDMINNFKLKDLSPKSMNKLFNKMAKNKKNLLDLYIAYSYRNSDTRPSCDEKCKRKKLCKVVTTVLWDTRKCKKIKLNSTMSMEYE